MTARVKKGFLTEKKSGKQTGGQARAAAMEAMTEDTKLHFAFTAPQNVNQVELLSVIKGFVDDLLGDFKLNVVGVCVTQGCCAVGVEYLVSEASALEGQIFYLRDQLVFKGEALSAVKVDHPEVFTKPPVVHHAPVAPPASPTVAEFLDEAPAAPGFPVVPPVPGFVPVADKSKAGANVVINKVAADMAVDDDESDNVSEASEVADEVTNKDIMREIKTMAKQRKHDNKKIRETTRVMIAEAVDPLWGEIRSQQSNLVDLGKASINHDDRIGRLESQFAKLDVAKTGKFNPNDVAHLRMSFSGFKGDDLDDRVATLKAFMEKHFADREAYACIDTRTTGAWNDQKVTGESFVQFFCRGARDRALKAVRDGKLGENLRSNKGDKLTVNRYRTDWQRGRDWAMRKSEELIKAKVETAKLKVKIEYVQTKDERKITANGQIAFLQKRADAHGSFLNDFSELKPP